MLQQFDSVGHHVCNADKVNSHVLVSFWNFVLALVPQVFEMIIVIDLRHLQCGSISPLSLLELPIKAHCMLTVPWDLNTMLEFGSTVA